MSNALECVCQEVNHLVLQGFLYRNKIWLFGDITLFGPTRSAIGKDMQPTISFLWNEDQGSCSLSLPLQCNHHHALINCNTILSTTETTDPCTRKVHAMDCAMYPNWVGYHWVTCLDVAWCVHTEINSLRSKSCSLSRLKGEGMGKKKRVRGRGDRGKRGLGLGLGLGG